MSIVTIDVVRSLVPNNDPRSASRLDRDYSAWTGQCAPKRWEGVLETPRNERKRLNKAIDQLVLPTYWMRTPRAWYWSASQDELWAEVHEQQTCAYASCREADQCHGTFSGEQSMKDYHLNEMARHDEWAALIRAVCHFRFRVRTA